jgi:hypothetical protein
MKKNKFVKIFCLLLLLSSSDDPVKVTMNELLATAKKDPKLTTNQQTLAFINTLNYNLPYLQKAEFRFGADVFDLGGQQYGINLVPNTLGQKRMQNAIKSTELNKSMAENSILLHQSLSERYRILTEVRFNQSFYEKEKTLESLLNQKKETLKKMIQQGLNVSVKDIADTENDRYDIQLNLLETEAKLAETNETVKQILGTSKEVLISFSNEIEVKDIEKVVKSIKESKNSATPEILFAKTEIEAEKAALNLENATNKEILRGVQLVSSPKSNTFLNSLGLRFTLGIPITGNSRLKRNELALDLKKAENKEFLLQNDTKKTIQIQIVTLENLIKKYNIYADKAENSLIKSLLNNTQLVAEMNAAELLDLKLSQQKTEVELVNIEYSILKQYLELLENTGLIVAMPLKNYLSVGLETF